MVEQKFDEIIHRFGLQVELRSVGADRSEAFWRAGVLDLRREKVQEDEVDMLDFIGTLIDELRGDHAVGNVAADAQSSRMSEFDNAGHQFRLERTVELDLDVAQIGIT